MARTLDPILKQDPAMEKIARLILEVRDRSHKWTSEVFRDWIALCVHALNRNDEEYLKIVDRYDKNREILDLFCKGFAELLMRGDNQDYYDILGPVYMGLAGSDKRMGQYFTPWPIAYLMAQMNFTGAELSKDSLTTVCEPSCGSGIMVLATCKTVAENYGPEALQRVHFTLVDLDYICAYMSALQLAAYNVPNWVVFQGNYLTSTADWKPIMGRGQQPEVQPSLVDYESTETETLPEITISGEQITLF